MRSLRLAASSWVVIVMVGCGGSTPPAETAAPPPIAPAGSSETQTAPASSGPEPAASPDLTIGIKAFDAGRYADARRSFEAAVRKTPSDYEALQNLALSCEKLGDKPAAEAAYKAALAAKPELDVAAENLTALYVDEGRFDDAIGVGRAGLAKHPRSAPLHENVGVALGSRGDQEAAIKELEEAVRLAPAEPMFRLTIAHWLNSWHVRGAAPHLDAARDLVKDDYGMLAAIGLEYRMAGEFDACVKTFDRAVALKDGGEVRTERALCKHGLKDEKGTFDDLQAAVTKEPGYAPGHYYLGGRLAMAKRFKESASEYAKYLQLEPNGSMAKPANERMKAAQEAMAKEKGAPKKK